MKHKLARMHAALHPVAFAMPHWLTLTLTTLVIAFGTGIEQYVQNVPMAQWLSGLSSPKTLLPILGMAFMSGVAALLAQALLLVKQWLATQPDAPAALPITKTQSIKPPPVPPVQT